MNMQRISFVKGLFGTIVTVSLAILFLDGAASAQQGRSDSFPSGSLAGPSVEGQRPDESIGQAGAISPPTIAIVEPANGSVITTKAPEILIGFSDAASGIEVSSFKILINGTDRTSLFKVTPSGASFQVPPADDSPGSRVIVEGQNLIVASVKNKAGLSATASSAFIVDTKVGGAGPAARKSPIERAFLLPPPLPFSGGPSIQPPPSISRDLVQFGYDQFSAPASTFAPVTDAPVPPGYVVGPGDHLVVYLWGLTENSFTVPVSSRGEIFLPKVGSVPVWGMTFSEVQRFIEAQLLKYFKGIQVNIAMGALRAIQVSVVGEVARPGRYTVSSLATVSNALYVAGGPTKLGSLRRIRLLRGKETVGTVDLYEFLLKGERQSDYPLQSGDTLFVPPIGPVAAIAGSVKRPGIYELNGPTRLSDLIEMAGGALPTAHLQRVQVERVEAHARKVVIDVDLSELFAGKDSPANLVLKDGDFVKLFPIDPRVYNTVTLEGFVKHPGEYQLKPGMRISHLLTPEAVLPEAYLERVEVVRLKRPALTQEILSVNVRRLWQGDRGEDLVLKPLDRVVVTSEFRTPASVILRGEVKRPGRYTIAKGERLSSVLARAGGFTEKAFLKGAVFTRAVVREIEKAQLEDFVRTQEQQLLAEASGIVISGIDREQMAIQQQTLTQRRELLRALAEKVTLGRVVIKLDELDRFQGSPSDIPLEDGDTLFIPTRPASVLVLGSVRNPTAVLFQEGQGVEYYLNRAGGLTKQADRKEIYLVKADGSAVAGFMKLRQVEPGDTVIVPPRPEVKVRPLPIARDLITIIGQTALTAAALAVIF